MRVFISVVSHRHASLIRDIKCLPKLADNYFVVLKNNCHEESLVLQKYCEENSIYLIDSDYNKGFGANNNIVYSFCENKFDFNESDVFIVLNPDVLITHDNLNTLVKTMRNKCILFSAITLYKSEDKRERDYSIRMFPRIMTFIKSFIGLGNDTIICDCDTITKVDWAAGSFLAFNALFYKKIHGFDERYFMYCEDVDICFRAKTSGCQLTYIPDVNAIHFAKHANRKIFSKHFFWHCKSIIIFLFMTKFKLKPKSII